MRGRISDALGALAAALRDREIRRVQVAWSGMITAEWAIIVALGVWAFDAGGAVGVGLMTLARTIPAGAVGPFLAPIADRHRRDHVLASVSVLRTLLVGGVALALIADAPTAVVYAVAALDAAAYTLYWPAQSSLLTELVRRPEELVAANVTSTTIENVGGLAGPMLAAAALGFTGPGGTVGLAAVVLAVCALALVPLARGPRAGHSTGATSAAAAEGRAGAGGAEPVGDATADLGGGLLAGFRHLARERRPRLVAMVYLSHTLAFGGLTVLVVVLALDALSLGESGVGLLTAGMGAGGVVGSLAALGLVGNPRLGRALATGVLAWALSAGLLGMAPVAALAVGLLAAAGVANALVDVAALTLLQRLVPERVLGRVLGVVEGVWWATLGIGGMGASLLAEWFGVRVALGAMGVLLAVAALAARAGMAHIDEMATVPAEVVAALLRDPILGPLPTQELERLALTAVPVEVAAGEVVVREGEVGEHYYVIRSGSLEAVGEGFRRVQGQGDGFGEIALLLAVPRTATVTAVEPSSLLQVDREAFLAAVGGHGSSAAAAAAVAEERLGA